MEGAIFFRDPVDGPIDEDRPYGVRRQRRRFGSMDRGGGNAALTGWIRSQSGVKTAAFHRKRLCPVRPRSGGRRGGRLLPRPVGKIAAPSLMRPTLFRPDSLLMLSVFAP